MPACPAGHESSATDFCDTCGMRIGGQMPGASPGAAPAASPAAGSAGGAAEQCPNCGADRAGLFCEACGFDFRAGRPASSVASPGTAATAAAASPATASPGTAAASPATASPGTAAAASPDTASQDPARPTASEAATSQAGLAPVTTASPVTGTGAATGTGWTVVVNADRAYFDAVIAAGGPDAALIAFPGYCPERRFALSGIQMRIGRRSASRGLEPEIDLTGPPTDPGISHLHAVLIAQPDGTWTVIDPGSSNGTQINGVDIDAGVAIPLHDGDRIGVGAWTILTIHAN